MASVKMSEEKAKYESLVGVIKKEMCKGGNGPCGENGVCKVDTNEDGEITSWCKCNDGFTGDWCEKSVVVMGARRGRRRGPGGKRWRRW